MDIKTVKEIIDSTPGFVASPFNNAGWMNNETGFRSILDNDPNIKSVLEIGSFTGACSTRLFGQYMKERGGTLTCVDPWYTAYQDQVDYWVKVCGFTFPTGKLYEQFLSNIQYFRLDTVVKAWQGMAANFFNLVRNCEGRPEYDLIYIDGDHRYEFAVLDIENALTAYPKAIIIGDDWVVPEWSAGVQKAVNEMAVKYNKEIIVDGNLWRLS